jgi:hypothetical protein
MTKTLLKECQSPASHKQEQAVLILARKVSGIEKSCKVNYAEVTVLLFVFVSVALFYQSIDINHPFMLHELHLLHGMVFCSEI